MRCQACTLSAGRVCRAGFPGREQPAALPCRSTSWVRLLLPNCPVASQPEQWSGPDGRAPRPAAGHRGGDGWGDARGAAAHHSRGGQAQQGGVCGWRQPAHHADSAGAWGWVSPALACQCGAAVCGRKAVGGCSCSARQALATQAAAAHASLPACSGTTRASQMAPRALPRCPSAP